jgi:hypothetical protein
VGRHAVGGEVMYSRLRPLRNTDPRKVLRMSLGLQPSSRAKTAVETQVGFLSVVDLGDC